MHLHVKLAEFWRASWEVLIQTFSTEIKWSVQWISNQSDIIILLIMYFIIVIKHNDLNNSVFNSLACMIIQSCVFW
jgi:predicted ATP-grasp superfamily ATP-dependent carboligase